LEYTAEFPLNRLAAAIVAQGIRDAVRRWAFEPEELDSLAPGVRSPACLSASCDE
jgi:hypothetical protein